MIHRLPRDAALVCAAGGLRAASVSLAGVLVAIHPSRRGLSTSAIGLIIGIGMISTHPVHHGHGRHHEHYAEAIDQRDCDVSDARRDREAQNVRRRPRASACLPVITSAAAFAIPIAPR